MSGGAKANEKGLELENKVAKVVEKAGYKQVDSKDFFFELRSAGGLIYARQCVIGMSVYGIKRESDLILYHPKHWPKCLVIESKWQKEGGTTDYKYPFEVLSIEANKYPTIVVMDGQGYNPSAKNWLQSQAAGLDNRLIHVMELKEFRRRFPKMRYWHTKSKATPPAGPATANSWSGRQRSLDAIRTFSRDLPKYPKLQGRLSNMKVFYVLEENGKMLFASGQFVWFGLAYDQSRHGPSLTRHYLKTSMSKRFESGNEKDLELYFRELKPNSREYKRLFKELKAEMERYGKAPRRDGLRIRVRV